METAKDTPVELLLVEDNPEDVELALKALREHRFGQNACVARDGAEALDFLFCRRNYVTRWIENRPRVVLLDLNLPLVDGIEVLRQVKSDRKMRMVPVVILTSSGREEDMKACYELGANSYIVKPVAYEPFSRAIELLGSYWLRLNELPWALQP